MLTYRLGKGHHTIGLAMLCAFGCQNVEQHEHAAVASQTQALRAPPSVLGLPPASLSHGLVAHWSFDEEPGAQAARDAAVLPDDASLRERTRRSDFGPARVANGFVFKPGSWFEVADSPDLDTIDSALTIAAWLKPLPGERAVFGRAQSGADDQVFFLRVDRSNRVLFEGPPGTPALRTPRNSLPPNKWSHVAVTWDTATTTAKIYVDGALLASSSAHGALDALDANPTATSSLTIGCDRAPCANSCFGGILDELLLYNRALEGSEIGDLAAGHVPLPPLVLSTIGREGGVAGYDPSHPITVGPDESGRYAYAVFSAPLTHAMRVEIEALGGHFGSLVARGPGFEAYELTVVDGDPNALAAAIKSEVPELYNLLPLHVTEKLTRSDDPVVVGEQTKVIVRCGEHVSPAACRLAIEPLLGSVIDFHSRFFVGLLAEAALLTVAAADAVHSVEQMSVPHLAMREARVVTGVDAAQSFTRFPVRPEDRLSGGGIVIGIYDSGVDASHPDFLDLETLTLRKEAGAEFTGPVNLLEGTDWPAVYSDHGTHVAGIAAGNGSHSGSYAQRGIAPAATLFSGRSGHFGPLEHGHVVNHSHINDRIGLYNGTDSDLDRVLHEPWSAKDGIFKTVVNAAGNNGRENLMHGSTQGFYSILNNAKNAIVVGNYDDGTGILSESSSQGPTVDGRIKPDLVAPGTDITSTSFASSEFVFEGGTPELYAEKDGTSMAAPHVSGVVALLHQIARDRHPDCSGSDICRAYGADALWSSTVKATLIHTADDLVLTEADAELAGRPRNADLGTDVAFYGEGPDFSTGWGLLDAERAIEVVENTDYSEHHALRQSEVRTYTFRVLDSSPLRVTLAWDDPQASPITLDPSRPASVGELSRLVNDLDMYLVDPLGQPHYPWRLEPFLTGAYASSFGIEAITQQTLRDHVAERDAVSALVDAPANFDHRNNVERIDVDSPAVGSWTLVVIGRSIDDVQHFSLVHPDSPLELHDSRLFYRTRDVRGLLSGWTDDGVTNESTESNDLHSIQFDTQGWIGGFLGVEARVTRDSGLGESVSDWYRQGRENTNYAHLFFAITQVELRVVNTRPSFESRYWQIRYRVRDGATGWMPWGCGGQKVGTSGVHIKAIQMELVTSFEPIECP